MPRIPSTLPQQPFGTSNNIGRRRALPTPVVLQKGPAQGLEQINHPEIPAPVLRALNTMQQNIKAAVGQAKAVPFANGNLVQQVALVQGGANGAGPHTVIQHGLDAPFTSYQIHAVHGGFVTGHTLRPNTSSDLDSAQVQIWTQFTAFPGQTVLADVYVYA